MAEYAYLFDGFWKSVDAILVLLGVWWLIQPSSLAELPGSMIVSGGRGDKLGFPHEFTARLLATSERRGAIGYRLNLGRLVGITFVAVGTLGIVTRFSEAVLFSVLTVVTVSILAVIFINPKRNAISRAAFLAGQSRNILPYWLPVVFLVEALAEASIGSVPSTATAIATVICIVLISLLAWQPIVLTGVDVELERPVDRCFRLGNLVTLTMFSQLPSLIWGASLDSFGSQAFLMRVIVSAVFLCVVSYSFVTVRRSKLELRQVAESLL